MGAVSSRMKSSSLVRRVLAKLRPDITPLQQQLAHHERALADITAALQDVQGPVLSGASDRTTAIERRIDLIESHLPQLLNVISSSQGSHRAMRREVVDLRRVVHESSTSISDVWQRIETVRRETMFELRYGASNERPTVEPKIVDEAKVAAGRTAGLRVNLGCGHIPLDGFVNIDGRDLPGVDVIAPVDHLPFEADELVEVHSEHLLEHFPQEQLEREFLAYWRGLLRPGGELRAVVPDAGAMLEGFAAGELPYADLREVLFGGQEYEGDFHFNMFTTASIRELLETAGFVDVVIADEGRRNGACLELQVVARKPG